MFRPGTKRQNLTAIRLHQSAEQQGCANFEDMNTRAFEEALQRQAIFELAIALIVLIALFWATYSVIKAGVRDGIIEAGPRTRTHEKPAAPPGYRWALVKETAQTEDIRAD